MCSYSMASGKLKPKFEMHIKSPPQPPPPKKDVQMLNFICLILHWEKTAVLISIYMKCRDTDFIFCLAILSSSIPVRKYV